jgi:hypothetical protein
VYVGANAGISNQTNTGYKTLFNGRLNYTKKFGAVHDFSALMVFSEEYWYDRYQGSSRNDRLYPTLTEIDAALTDIQSTGGNSSAEGFVPISVVSIMEHTTNIYWKLISASMALQNS